MAPMFTMDMSEGEFPPLGATSRSQRAVRGGTAKGGLAMLQPPSVSSSRAPSEAGDILAERAGSAPSPLGKKKKKSKKAKKGGLKSHGTGISTAGLEKPDFLLQPLPLRKACLQEDWSFVKRSVPSAASSIASSPPRSGLSSLLSQAHPGDLLEVRGSDTEATSEDDQVDTYEVAIAHDYVSKEVDSRPVSRAGKLTDSPRLRKKVSADDFEVLKILGQGTYGTVTLVRHKASGKLYAQKQLKKATIVVHKRVIEQTKTERAILESVRHQNVVKLYYAFQDREKLYLILEYAQGGELFHHLNGARMFPESTVSFYIAQIVLALSHLHMNAGVVYRDLKPENCLLDADGNLLLTDFGLSKVRTDDDRCSSLLGTAEYMAPEVLNASEGKEYGSEVDWWGVGILAFELLTGDTPYRGNSPGKVKERIKTRKLNLPHYLSLDSKDLIRRLLQKQPEKRLGHNIERDLPIIKAHRFFRKIDWGKLERQELVPPIRPLVTDPVLAENFSDEFTEMLLSPREMGGAWMMPGKEIQADEENLFGGFSFVATSLLEKQSGFLTVEEY